MKLAVYGAVMICHEELKMYMEAPGHENMQHCMNLAFPG